jgi:hypothetical protein
MKAIQTRQGSLRQARAESTINRHGCISSNPKKRDGPLKDKKGDSRKTGLAVANFAGMIVRIVGTVLQTEEKLQEKLLEVSA